MKAVWTSEWCDEVFDSKEACEAWEDEYFKCFENLPLMLNANFKPVVIYNPENAEQLDEVFYVNAMTDEQVQNYNELVDRYLWVDSGRIPYTGKWRYDSGCDEWINIDDELEYLNTVVGKLVC